MNQKNSGYVMAGIGFVMLLVNVYGYLSGDGINNPVFTVLGLIFVVIGMKMMRKKITK